MKKLLLILLCFPIITIAQYGKKKSEKSQFETIEIKAEMPFMDMKLKSINDLSYSLKELTEKNGVIVIFTSNTCPFVIKWEDRYTIVEELAKKNNIGVAYINSNYKKRKGDDSFKNMKKHANTKCLNLLKTCRFSKILHQFLLENQQLHLPQCRRWA